MEIGSAGAGSVALTAPTQTGSQKEVVEAQSQQQRVEQSATSEQQTASQPNDRVGTVVDVQV